MLRARPSSLLAPASRLCGPASAADGARFARAQGHATPCAMRGLPFTLTVLFLTSTLWLVPRTTAAQARFADPAADVERVFALLAARLALMPAVAAWKWQQKVAIADPAREESVLLETEKQAAALGIEAESAHALLSLQMRFARDVQQRSFTHWEQAGFDVRKVKDLTRELRPELDRLGFELLRALAAALPAFVLPDFRVRHSARAASLMSTAGLSAEDGQALLAALGDVRASPTTHWLERIRARGELRVGTTGDYAPFSLESAGKLRGVDIALAEAFARSLGVRVRFLKTSWPTLMRDYQNDAFDVALSGISHTPERAASARFSVPYQSGGKTPIARCSERTKLATLAQIDNEQVRVIVNPGGTNEAFVRAQLKRANVRVFADNRAIFAELLAGRADVMITDDVEAELQHRRHPGLCRTNKATFTQADKAWLVQPDDQLVDTVDTWLKSRLGDRTVARLLSRALAQP